MYKIVKCIASILLSGFVIYIAYIVCFEKEAIEVMVNPVKTVQEIKDSIALIEQMNDIIEMQNEMLKAYDDMHGLIEEFYLGEDEVIKKQTELLELDSISLETLTFDSVQDMVIVSNQVKALIK